MGTTSDLARNERVIQVVTFDLGEQEFGIDISSVREIIRMVQATKLPGAPAFLEGVIELRGHVIPVIDLHNRLGLGVTTPKKEACILILDIVGRTFGVLIDSVKEVLHLPENVIEPPPVIMVGTDGGCIASIGKLENEILYLLDANKLISNNKNQTELSE